MSEHNEALREAMIRAATTLIETRLNISSNQACGAAEQVVDLVFWPYVTGGEESFYSIYGHDCDSQEGSDE